MAVEGYHDVTIEQAILASKDIKLIKEINELAMKKNCRISICHSKDIHKNKELRFIVMLGLNSSDNQIIPDFDIAKISAFLKDSINYDLVVVGSKGEYDSVVFEELFEVVTLFFS